MIWWMLNDPNDGSWDNGLVTADNLPRRKQSFFTYQTLVNRMTHKEFVRALPAAETGRPTIEAYQFRDLLTGAIQYIAWLNPVTTPNSATLSLSAEEVRRVSHLGASLGIIPDEADGVNDGRVTVPVSADPVYIEVIR